MNSDKQGFIDEKIYEYQEDPEEIVEKIQKMSVDYITQNTDKIVAPWPNTYTFTKNLCERAIRKHRGTLPVLILRPAIIICS